MRAPLSWYIRRTIWNSISLIIFRGKKPDAIPLPPKSPRALRSVPVSARIPGVQIDDITMADRIPRGETSLKMRLAFSFRIWLGKWLPPVVHGLPEIDADINLALDEAFTKHYAALYPRPKLPDVFKGAGLPDLGLMATHSPYAGFIHRDAQGALVWDFRDLDDHETHVGLRPLGCRVVFDLVDRRLHAARIECVLGTITPEDDRWREAVRTALCAASTQISLVAHFNGVHLACGGPFSIATRNHLYFDHPMMRLMWPHMFGTQNSNYLVTKGQMLPGGDFETVFSFTHRGMCDLFSRSFNSYRASVIVPALDWRDRGLEEGAFDAPVHDNWVALYDVMQAHTTRYINHYWPKDSDIARDEAVVAWVRALEEGIPGGVAGITGGVITRSSMATLCAGFIFMASVQHEVLGSRMWDYQMWVDQNPVRIHVDGSRIPVDVFQRLLNANFNLNVERAALMQDFSYLAVDDAGKKLFAAFLRDLEALEREMAALPAAPWRVTPAMLDANINA